MAPYLLYWNSPLEILFLQKFTKCSQSKDGLSVFYVLHFQIGLLYLDWFSLQNSVSIEITDTLQPLKITVQMQLNFLNTDNMKKSEMKSQSARNFSRKRLIMILKKTKRKQPEIMNQKHQGTIHFLLLISKVYLQRCAFKAYQKISQKIFNRKSQMNLNLWCSMIKLHWKTKAWYAQPLTNFFPKTKHSCYF